MTTISNTHSNASRAVLSIILNIGKPAMDKAVIYLKDVYFIEAKYKMIWKSMLWLYEHDNEINEIMVENSLLVNRDNTGMCGFDMLDPKHGKHHDEMLAIKAFKANEGMKFLRSYIDILIDKYGSGKYYDMAQEIMGMAKDGKATVGQLQATVNKYSKFFIQRDHKMPRLGTEILQAMIEKLGDDDSEGDQSIIQTGIPMIDESIALTPGNVTYIAGDSRHGKTSLALQIAWNIAKQKHRLIDKDTGESILDENGNKIYEHRRVVFFSLEMSEEELFNKLICIHNNFSYDSLRLPSYEGYIKPTEQKRLKMEFLKLYKQIAPNFIPVYEGVDTLNDIQSECLRIEAIYGDIDLVCLDYLQLVEEGKNIQRNREDEGYRAISRFMKKHIASKLGTHVIALSQLNGAQRNKDGFINHEPTLARLFGSTAIKQDATHVLFVYRQYVEGITKLSEITSGGKTIKGASTYFMTKLIFAKNRFGGQSEIMCGFIPYLAYFIPIEEIVKNGLLHMSDKDLETYKFPHRDEFMKAQ